MLINYILEKDVLMDAMVTILFFLTYHYYLITYNLKVKYKMKRKKNINTIYFRAIISFKHFIFSNGDYFKCNFNKHPL